LAKPDYADKTVSFDSRSGSMVDVDVVDVVVLGDSLAGLLFNIEPEP
jgi:hypothetical protein